MLIKKDWLVLSHLAKSGNERRKKYNVERYFFCTPMAERTEAEKKEDVRRIKMFEMLEKNWISEVVGENVEFLEMREENLSVWDVRKKLECLRCERKI